jgi:SAM-dependent methyltransferase
LGMPELDDTVRRYYERGGEADRLTGGLRTGPLEFARTTRLLERFLPPAPLGILDVGGGPGAYAAWLADRGDRVHVVDPIALHVDQATAAHPNVTAEVGDARQLPQASGSVDAVLLMGPLYHLVDRADRLRSLTEARRVLRPGGVLVAAGISRYAGLLDLLAAERLHEPDIRPIVAAALESGAFLGDVDGLFTTAYFHLPRDLRAEVNDAGFENVQVLSIEGPGILVGDFDRRWADPVQRETMLWAAEVVESDPEMLAAGGHLLAVARAPGQHS